MFSICQESRDWGGPVAGWPKPGQRELGSSKEPETPLGYLARNKKDFPGAPDSSLVQSLHTHSSSGPWQDKPSFCCGLGADRPQQVCLWSLGHRASQARLDEQREPHRAQHSHVLQISLSAQHRARTARVACPQDTLGLLWGTEPSHTVSDPCTPHYVRHPMPAVLRSSLSCAL